MLLSRQAVTYLRFVGRERGVAAYAGPRKAMLQGGLIRRKRAKGRGEKKNRESEDSRLKGTGTSAFRLVEQLDMG